MRSPTRARSTPIWWSLRARPRRRATARRRAATWSGRRPSATRRATRAAWKSWISRDGRASGAAAGKPASGLLADGGPYAVGELGFLHQRGAHLRQLAHLDVDRLFRRRGDHALEAELLHAGAGGARVLDARHPLRADLRHLRDELAALRGELAHRLAHARLAVAGDDVVGAGVEHLRGRAADDRVGRIAAVGLRPRLRLGDAPRDPHRLADRVHVVGALVLVDPHALVLEHAGVVAR